MILYWGRGTVSGFGREDTEYSVNQVEFERCMKRYIIKIKDLEFMRKNRISLVD